jgi:hypothetical protein
MVHGRHWMLPGPDTGGGGVKNTPSPGTNPANPGIEDTMQTALKVGDYARSLETGWLGKIVEIKTEVVVVAEDRSFVEHMAKMIGVDWMSHTILGRSIEESLSYDDVQFFSLTDLIPA